MKEQVNISMDFQATAQTLGLVSLVLSPAMVLCLAHQMGSDLRPAAQLNLQTDTSLKRTHAAHGSEQQRNMIQHV